MVQSITMFRVLALGSNCSSIAVGQTQGSALFAGDDCVKVREDKAQEFRTLRQNATTTLAALRVESGVFFWHPIALAVAPTGRPVRRDYHLAATDTRFPADPAGAKRMAADRNNAGRTMSQERVIAKHQKLTDLVGIDAWKQLAGNTATLVAPGREEVPYNTMTTDVLPDLAPNWATQGKGIPARTTRKNVHPNTGRSAHRARLAAIRNQTRVDVVRLVDFIEKQHRLARHVAALRQENPTATDDPVRVNPKALQSRLTKPATLAPSVVLIRDANSHRKLPQRLWR